MMVTKIKLESCMMLAISAAAPIHHQVVMRRTMISARARTPLLSAATVRLSTAAAEAVVAAATGAGVKVASLTLSAAGLAIRTAPLLRTTSERAVVLATVD